MRVWLLCTCLVSLAAIRFRLIPISRENAMSVPSHFFYRSSINTVQDRYWASIERQKHVSFSIRCLTCRGSLCKTKTHQFLRD